MTAQVQELARLSRFEDPRLGISEQFLQPRLGGVGTLAILSRPLGRLAPFGWVLCHSFGMEQVHLYRLEVHVARALSAAGFPVLRFHSPGYGDSQGTAADVSLSSHLAGAADAAELLGAEDGVERVGLMGARFGGTVAAMTADRLGLSLLALWEPVINGQRYMRDFLWRRVFSTLASGEVAGDLTGAPELMRQLRSGGWADVNGFLMREQVFDEISGIDLLRDLRSFTGATLVLSVARSAEPTPGVAKLAERLRGLGGDCRLGVVVSRYAHELGQSHFRADEEIVGKKDTQMEITVEVARLTVAWSLERAGASPTVSGQS